MLGFLSIHLDHLLLGPVFRREAPQPNAAPALNRVLDRRLAEVFSVYCRSGPVFFIRAPQGQNSGARGVRFEGASSALL